MQHAEPEEEEGEQEAGLKEGINYPGLQKVCVFYQGLSILLSPPPPLIKDKITMEYFTTLLENTYPVFNKKNITVYKYDVTCICTVKRREKVGIVDY